MPHCLIEFSNNLIEHISPNDMMEVVYQATLDTGFFIPSTIKVRATSYLYTMGEAERFVHVNASILSGRTTEQKMVLSDLILQRLQCLPFPPVDLSVDIVDMRKETYSKGKCLG